MLFSFSKHTNNYASRIKKGDKEAFREVYYIYYKQLYTVAGKYLKDSQMAEDAVQEIFIGLWLKRESLDPSQSLKNFLFTCLKNHVLNMIKSRKRRILLAYEANEEKPQAANSTEADFLYSEYKAIIQQGLEELPVRRREIFELKTYQGLTNPQIAETLSISINTVKNHYYHSNKFLRSYLREKAGIRSV
jgi:RNA polymerase sigma-70 factor (family 1)